MPSSQKSIIKIYQKGEPFMKFLTALLIACSACVFADEVKDSATGITFPSEVTIEHAGKTYPLQATGVATRKKLIVSVYSVASYLQKGPISGDKFAAVLADDKAKQLTMKWARDVEASKIQDGYKESFSKALSPSDQQKMQNEINQFIQFFGQDAKKGDEYVLRAFPDGFLEVVINGKSVGNITNKEFVKSLWGIWFGQKSVVDRQNLVSLMH